jgi:hypothetical protein
MGCTLEVYNMACVFQDAEITQDEYIFPEDITGWEIELEFKTNFNSNTFIKFSTEDNSIEITDGPGGKFIRKAKKAEVPVGTYFADLMVLKPGYDYKTIYLRQTIYINETYST